METVRWTFEDLETSETWIVPINPNEATSHRPLKELSYGIGHDGRVRTRQRAPQPVEWSFGGVIRTQEHHDLLTEWSKKPGKLRVTDHLGRTFEIMISSIEIEDRTPTPSVPWRLRYTMNALLLRRIP